MKNRKTFIYALVFTGLTLLIVFVAVKPFQNQVNKLESLVADLQREVRVLCSQAELPEKAICYNFGRDAHLRSQSFTKQ